MKNIFLCIPFMLLFAACNDYKRANSANSNTAPDTASKKVVKPKTIIGFDTTGLSMAPVKILQYSLSDKLVDTFDDKSDNLHHEGHFKRYVLIRLKYKNISSKRIIGVKFDWYMVDSFGKPSDLHLCDNCLQSVGMGWTGSLAKYPNTQDIKIGETINNEWLEACKNGVKILYAAPVEVEFYDNTKWSLGQNY